MTVNVNSFKMNTALVELVFMEINTMGFDEDAEKKMKEDMNLDAFENIEEPIQPKAGKDLLDFSLKHRNSNANVTICPRYSIMFDKNAAKTFEEQKRANDEAKRKRIEQEREEVKKNLVEKEAEVARLRRDIVGK